MKNKKSSNNTENRICRLLLSSLYTFLIFTFLLLVPGHADVYGLNAKYIILLISDGWGAKHIEATNNYTGTIPLYQSDPNWTRYWMSTFPEGGSYNTAQAWSDFNYVLNGYTDSAAAATALYSGFKTSNSRVTVSSDASTAFFSMGERAKELGRAVGAVSTVPVSHATPGTWVAHNDDRGNTFAIADEGLFGDPNTTGTAATDVKYAGGHGPTIPPVDVLIGAEGSGYVSSQILTKLRNETGQPGKHVLVERQSGVDGGDALTAKANNPATEKLAGLFDQIYHNANGSGYNPENPTLSESALAAIKVLSKNPNGFVLMIEGGAIDWAAHANNMNQMIGEQKDYDNAVQTVINWVNDPANDSDWDNTLVIVTGDHETGYLTKNSGIFPNQPLGAVNSTTLAKEKIVSGTGGRRASWEDADGDSIIDSGETVYWRWNSGGHTNSLIPLYARGAGSELFAAYDTNGPDTVRGYHIDNTDVFLVMEGAVSDETCIETGSISTTPGQTLSGNPIDLTSIVTADKASNLNYTVAETGSCPARTNASIITRRDTWKYNGANNGNIGTAWKNTAYDDSGWNTGRGIFGFGENYITTLIGATGQMSMYFRKAFTICDADAVTSLKFNATYDDGITVYINGTQVIAAGVSGNPPLWNGGSFAGESNQTYHTFNLDAYKGLLVPGTNVIAIGAYNVSGTSSDMVFDGELVISSVMGDSTLFTGNSSQAQSVDTAGWTNGGKKLEVIADDAACLTPLPSANDTFTFDSGPACTETGSIEITPGQTLYGNPLNLTSIVTTTNAANTVYTVTDTGSSCNVDPGGTYIEAENFTGTIGQGTGTFVLSTSQAGHLGTGYLRSSGGSSAATACPSHDEGKQYQVNFNQTGTYYVWMRGYAIDGTTDSVFIGLDGTCAGSLNENKVYNQWVWSKNIQNGTNTINVTTPGVHTINIWIRDPNHLTDGIYITQGTETPTDASHGVKINPTNCSATLFSGNQTEAQVVNTSGWTNGTKNLAVTGDDAFCLTPLTPANETFTFGSGSIAGITVTPTSGLITTESGSTAGFTIVLNTTPTAKVTIDIISSDIMEGTVSPASVTFTPENWNAPQTVTITGVNDAIQDGNIAFTIMTAAASSTDTYYNGVNAPDVSVTNNDNDAAGITVTPTSGLVTTEAGGTAAFTVKLNTQPTANVTIGLSSSDTTEGTVSPASLTFTSANWNTSQTVTVTGVNDALQDGNILYSIITAAASSSDANYSGINTSDVSVTNNDNEAAGITVIPTSGLVTTEKGGRDSFIIVLNTAPSARVTIYISSSDISEGTVSSASVAFTPEDWNKAKRITVKGVNDFINDGNQAYTIITHPAVSTDSTYNGIDPDDVSVINNDNDGGH